MLVPEKKIPAIVLSYDRNRVFAENMILSYQELWRSHPFHFFVPYQENLKLHPNIDRSSVTLVNTKPQIRETVLALLEPFEDDDLVFWSIDDKFPTLLRAGVLNSVFSSLMNPAVNAGFQALLFTRARSLVSFPGIDRTETEVLGLPAYRVHTNNQFWLHQLVRVGRLRDFFGTLPEISQAKEMDRYVRNLPSPDSVFVLKTNALILNESTSRGVPTTAALGSLQEKSISIPSGLGSASVEIRPIGQPTLGERVRKYRHDLCSFATKYRTG